MRRKTLAQRALESACGSLAISLAERKYPDTLSGEMQALIGSHIAGYENGYKASAATKSRQKPTNTEVGRKRHLRQMKLRGYRPFGPTLGGMIWVKLASYRPPEPPLDGRP